MAYVHWFIGISETELVMNIACFFIPIEHIHFYWIKWNGFQFRRRIRPARSAEAGKRRKRKAFMINLSAIKADVFNFFQCDHKNGEWSLGISYVYTRIFFYTELFEHSLGVMLRCALIFSKTASGFEYRCRRWLRISNLPMAHADKLQTVQHNI